MGGDVYDPLTLASVILAYSLPVFISFLLGSYVYFRGVTKMSPLGVWKRKPKDDIEALKIAQQRRRQATTEIEGIIKRAEAAQAKTSGATNGRIFPEM